MPGQAAEGKFREIIYCGIAFSRAVHSHHPGFPKQIDDLADIAEKEMSADGREFKIRFHPRIYQAKAILGKIVNFGGSADIYYDLNQNVCWRRFILAKEICQIIYIPDSEDHLTGTPADVEQLLTKIMAGLPPNDSAALNCDSTTKLMALEVLLPHHERNAVEADMKNGKTILDIATKYRIPQAWVRLYITSDYKVFMDSCYKAQGL